MESPIELARVDAAESEFAVRDRERCRGLERDADLLSADQARGEEIVGHSRY